jgi:hypothetical protein
MPRLAPVTMATRPTIFCMDASLCLSKWGLSKSRAVALAGPPGRRAQFGQ